MIRVMEIEQVTGRHLDQEPVYGTALLVALPMKIFGDLLPRCFKLCF
jgi:hypothetical protein